MDSDGQSELTGNPDLTSSSIGELTDVDTSSVNHVPSDGQVLTWQTSHNHWMQMDTSIPGLQKNTGGVPITNPEVNLGAGDQLTWSDGTVGRGQIGGITNTGTQPVYVTDTELDMRLSSHDQALLSSCQILTQQTTSHQAVHSHRLTQLDYERVVGTIP